MKCHFPPPRILSIEAIDFDDQPVVEIVVRGYVEVRGVRYQLEETVELDLWVGSGWARTRNPFSYVSEIDVPAQSDADGNINVGINHRFGINGLPTPLVEGFGHAPLLMDFGVDVGNNNWYSYSGSLRLAPNAPVWVISPDDYNYTDDLEFSRWSYQLSYVGSRS